MPSNNDDEDKTFEQPNAAKKNQTKKLSTASILNILFLGILLSFFDFVTDFLQGTNLIRDVYGIWKDQNDVQVYGIIILIIVWIPGALNFIHIFLDQNRSHSLLYYCVGFLIYPLVPTLCHIVKLIGKYNTKETQEFVFQVIGINSCLEAPIQIMMTFFLVLKGVFQPPWSTEIEIETSDQFGNKIYNIPLIAFVFSILGKGSFKIK